MQWRWGPRTPTRTVCTSSRWAHKMEAPGRSHMHGSGKVNSGEKVTGSSEKVTGSSGKVTGSGGKVTGSVEKESPWSSTANTAGGEHNQCGKVDEAGGAPTSGAYRMAPARNWANSGDTPSTPPSVSVPQNKLPPSSSCSETCTWQLLPAKTGGWQQCGAARRGKGQGWPCTGL